MKLVCMIPARLASKRVEMKNIRYLGDKPLVMHVIEACKKSKIFDEIYLNASEDVFETITEISGIKFYKRPPKLSEGNITNDLFMEDFLKHIECDYVIQVNPTSPFISSNDIINFKNHMIENNYHTVQSVKSERIEGLFSGAPLNFDPRKIMPESQNLKPVLLFSSGIMGFKKTSYLENMKNLGAATYGGNFPTGYFELKGYANIDIDYEEDFKLAEVIYSLLKNKSQIGPRYFSKNDATSFSEKKDADRKQILLMDGVDNNNMQNFNKETINLNEIIKNHDEKASWSHTLINTKSNCATIIAQKPGEGNRRHYHSDWDEWWLILQGEWEWEIEGVPKRVKEGDLVFIERNRKHKISAVGNKMAIRLAVSREDVDHIYSADDY